MSKEYAAENILVNTVCIGLIKSAQNERDWRREAGEAAQPTLEEWCAREGAGIPLGRVGETTEAGDVIAFLASERASYVTGTAINVDGCDSPVV